MQYVLSLGLACCCLLCQARGADAAEPPARPTHALQPVLLEVAATRPNGNPWDTGIGAFARPDPQVTLLRPDANALREATELFVQASEKRLKDLGRPVDPRIRELLARDALNSLRCGRTMEALNDQPLKDARGKFAADTSVASDSLLAKLEGGSLPVAVGDKILIFVNEIDLASHDSLGEYELAITKELLSKGEVELKFGSVESLRLKLAPLGKR